MHKPPLSRLFPALILVACSSGEPVAKPGETRIPGSGAAAARGAG